MEIEIYTKDWCPYCHRATGLLDSLGLQYRQYDITDDPKGQQEMIARSHRTTVPQVFFDGKPIGGCTDLFDLHARGELVAAKG